MAGVTDLSAVIGGGPAGLMAAERLLTAGRPTALYEAGARCGRKFVLAGRGGLNLTTADPDPAAAYCAAATRVASWLARFGPIELATWAEALGGRIVTGNGGRRFWRDRPARAIIDRWLDRLQAAGLVIHYGWRWQGWDTRGDLCFATATGPRTVNAATTILACGGASWPSTGSDGAWVAPLRAAGVAVHPLRPANCGVSCRLPPALTGHAGTPLRNAALILDEQRSRGNLILTADGLEGGAVYRLVPHLRHLLATGATPTLLLDAQPDLTAHAVAARLQRSRGSRSLATHLHRCLKLDRPIPALLHATTTPAERADPAILAAQLKALPLVVTGLRPLAEAISTAGGVALDALDDQCRIRALGPVFACGEMLDWEAPTGGYLLQGCFTTGFIAGDAAAALHGAAPAS